MKIDIHLDTEDTGDLIAFSALISSLAGDRAVNLADKAPAVPAAPAARPAPPPPPAPSQSDTLMASEAARAAAAQAGDDDDGEAADPASLDTAGIPWDARIHAGTKTKNKDGSWKKLRGVDEVTYGQVVAELQERQAGNGQPAAAPLPPTTAAAPPPPPPSPETASAPTAAPPPPAGAVQAGGRFADFPSFVQSVNALRDPPIAYVELNQTAASIGVADGFKDMKDAPHLWETFYGMLGGQ